MLSFLANILEQVDLALEHVSKGDVNNARFGLMLTDNAVELTLHQIAVDKKAKLQQFAHLREGYGHAAELERALGQHFAPKLKFAKVEGKLASERAESIAILHEFRNEVYHIGIKHGPVLPTLSVFYFRLACEFLAAYDPRGLSWGSNEKLPERARKYFTDDRMMPGGIEQYRAACETLGNAVGYDASKITEVLADHMSNIIEEQDACVDLVATGGPNRMSRDKAVVETQTWKLAFSKEGKQYAREHGWGGGTFFEYLEWLATNYHLQFRRDPIPSWERRVQSLYHENNPHKALKRYRSFMDQTAEIRENLYESAGQVEMYIEGQIERMRLERR